LVTIVAVNPTKIGNVSYIETVTKGFETDYLEIEDISELPIDKPIIIFHPRTHDNNPEWLPPKRVENFMDFDFPEDAYYVIAGDFGTDIAGDIDYKAGYLKDKTRWVKIPTKKDFKSLHGHQAVAIILWERWKRKGDTSLDCCTLEKGLERLKVITHLKY